MTIKRGMIIVLTSAGHTHRTRPNGSWHVQNSKSQRVSKLAPPSFWEILLQREKPPAPEAHKIKTNIQYNLESLIFFIVGYSVTAATSGSHYFGENIRFKRSVRKIKINDVDMVGQMSPPAMYRGSKKKTKNANGNPFPKTLMSL